MKATTDSRALSRFLWPFKPWVTWHNHRKMDVLHLVCILDNHDPPHPHPQVVGILVYGSGGGSEDMMCKALVSARTWMILGTSADHLLLFKLAPYLLPNLKDNIFYNTCLHQHKISISRTHMHISCQRWRLWAKLMLYEAGLFRFAFIGKCSCQMKWLSTRGCRG